MNMAKLDTFTRAYIEAMLWSETDPGNDDRPLDRDFDESSFDADELARIVADCNTFQEAFSELIGYDDERAGHDFWLTRVGHGCGFWDGDWPEPAATVLTAGAKWFGHVDVIPNDESLILEPDPCCAAMHALRLDREECEIALRYVTEGVTP